MGLGLLLACPAAADWSCETCVSGEPYQVAASSDYERRNAERAEARRQRDIDRRERAERREAERKGRNKLYGLERQIRKEERKERDVRYSNPQAGAHCMYGPDGKLIHAPRGSVCPATNYEPADGGATPPQAAAPGQQGCVSGDCKNGKGTFVWPSGSRYVGEFKSGRQHGLGSLAFSNGASYVGAWENGKRSGQGTAVYPDGRVESGTWAANKLVSADESPPIEIAWPDLSRPAAKQGGGKYDAAVIVGVEDYAHVADIPGATDNARDWYRYLVKTRGIPTKRVTLLLDADATREEMHVAAETAAREVGKKGSLWFVFVGHGAASSDGEDALLIGFDAQQRARSIEARSLRRAKLLAALESSKAKHVNVLLDACFSGREQSGTQLVAGLQPLVVTSETPTSDPRTTLMTAARSDQFAGPLPGAQRPAFSYLALGGLRGWADLDADGHVASAELHEYVSDTMRALIRGRSQNPTLTGSGTISLAPSAKETGPDIAEFVVGNAASAAR